MTATCASVLSGGGLSLRGRVEAGKSGGSNLFGYDVVRRFGAKSLAVRGERKM